MGARESRPEGESEVAEAPPDYYSLLEVDENATADEIKVCRDRLLGMPAKAKSSTRNHSAGLHSFTIRTRTTTT